MATPVFITSLDASEGGDQVFINRGFRLKISTPATLTTSLAGANNDITYTSKLSGTSGNAVTVAYAGGSALGVGVSGNAITVTLATNAQDTVATSGVPASVRASGTITTSSTGAANNDTVTIGATTYTFKTTLTGAANEILRDGTIDHDLTNLIDALQHGIGGANEGVKYGTGTVIRTDVSLSAIVSHVVTVTATSYNATIGNAIVLSKSSSLVSVSGSGTLASGTNETVVVNGHTYRLVEALDAATADEVLISGQDTSLTNLASAINGTTGAGTVYGTGTVANTDATASALGVGGTHTITLTATASGTAGNSLTLAVTGSHVSRGSATFANGGSSSGSISSTANNVVTAIQGSTPASALVDVHVASGNDGTGVVTALSTTSLAGGTDPGSVSGSVISGIEVGTSIQQGVIYEVDIDDPQTRKILSRYYLRWFEVPGGDLTKVPVRSLLLSNVTTQNNIPTGTQSLISRGTPIALQEILTQGTETTATVKPGAASTVDLTIPAVRRSIRQHRDQLISAAGSSQTLVTIRGLVTTKSIPQNSTGLVAGRGFRISKYGKISNAAGSGSVTYVNSTTSVQVDLADFNVRRALRRNIGRWIVVSAP